MLSSILYYTKFNLITSAVHVWWTVEATKFSGRWIHFETDTSSHLQKCCWSNVGSRPTHLITCQSKWIQEQVFGKIKVRWLEQPIGERKSNMQGEGERLFKSYDPIMI